MCQSAVFKDITGSRQIIDSHKVWDSYDHFSSSNFMAQGEEAAACAYSSVVTFRNSLASHLRYEHHTPFLQSSEYELLLNHLQLGDNAQSYLALLPRHMSMHRQPVLESPLPSGNELFAGLCNLSETGISIVIESCREGLLGTLKQFLTPPAYDVGTERHLHHFVFPQDHMRLYGCALFSSVRRTTTPLTSPDSARAASASQKSLLDRGKKLASKVLRTAGVRDMRPILPAFKEDEATFASEESAMLELVAGEVRRGVFLVSPLIPAVDSLRASLLVDLLPKLEAEELTLPRLTALLSNHRPAVGRGDVDSSVLTLVSHNNLAMLLVAILLEMSILLVADDTSALVAFLECLLECAYPLKWPHTYCPYLPDSMIDLLQTPTPFLVGVITSTYQRALQTDISSDILILQLDDGLVMVDSEWQTKYEGTMKRLAHTLQSTTLGCKYKDQVCRVFTGKTETSTMACCHMFVNKVLNGYECAIMDFNIEVDNEGKWVVFDGPLFTALKNREGFDFRFIEALLLTQGFSCYIASCPNYYGQ
jgi:hypothetical protein